jgi:hypothetical protein
MAGKPSLADVALMTEPDADDQDGDAYAASVDELADVLGVSADKRDAFRSAFEAACMACK